MLSLVRISLLEILLSPLSNARSGALSVEVVLSHTAFSDKVCGKSEGVTVGGRKAPYQGDSDHASPVRSG